MLGVIALLEGGEVSLERFVLWELMNEVRQLKPLLL